MTTTTTRSVGCGLLLLFALLGCGKRAAPEAAQQEVAPAKVAQPSPAAAPTPAPSAAPTGPARAGGLEWQDVPPFVRRAPKSAMRAAEYGVAGDDLAELTVFYFGPDQGGSVQANEARWLGQFTQPDGSDSADKAKRSKRDVGPIAVSLIEVTGNFSGGMAMPGAPAPSSQTDAMMLAAIATGPQGPVFFKLTGPRATVEQTRPAFDQLIASLH